MKTEVRREQIATIARRVGLVPSASYRHCDGKNQVLDQIRQLLLENVEAVPAGTADPVEALRQLLLR